MMLTSTYNLVFITSDRCLKISLPLWYRKHVTKPVTYSAVAFAWMFGSLFQLLAWYGLKKINTTNLTCVENQNFSDSPQPIIIIGITILVELILPMTNLVVCYGIILHKIRRQRRVMGENSVREAKQQGIKILICIGITYN